jgi:hypothetical protein
LLVPDLEAGCFQGKTASVGYARGMDFLNEAVVLGRITDECIKHFVAF